MASVRLICAPARAVPVTGAGRRRSVSMATATANLAAQESRSRSPPTYQRRHVSVMPFLTLVAAPALAADSGDGDPIQLQPYDGGEYSLSIPKGWVSGEGAISGGRKVTAFYPSEDTSANVTVLVTYIRPDYTAMGSLGSVDRFAAILIGTMGEGAQLVNAVSKNDMYYVEYTVQVPGEVQRHLVSVAGLGRSMVSRPLYTVTGQYLEADADKYKRAIKEAIESFRIGKQM